MFFGSKNKQPSDPALHKSTQNYLAVNEVRDGIVLLRDGGLRVILAVSSVNFALKSEDEQNALIIGYQNFLNSIDFPIQILMQSRPLDINPYLSSMKERMDNINNKLLQMQMAEYIEFVSRLVETAKIMSKTFYLIVPYNPANIKHGFFNAVASIFNPTKSIVIDTQSFEEYKKELGNRVSQIKGGLGSLGLDSIELDTQEAIELLYSSYNIGAASSLHAEALNRLEVQKIDV